MSTSLVLSHVSFSQLGKKSVDGVVLLGNDIERRNLMSSTLLFPVSFTDGIVCKDGQIISTDFLPLLLSSFNKITFSCKCNHFSCIGSDIYNIYKSAMKTSIKSEELSNVSTITKCTINIVSTAPSKSDLPYYEKRFFFALKETRFTHLKISQ